MAAMYEEERIKGELDKLEWLRQAILSYTPDNSVENTNMRVHNLTEVTGHIARLKRQLYICQHPEVDN